MSETHESLKPIKTTVKDVIALVETLAPPSLALPNDPIGLHVGSRSQVVEKVLVALDASPKTAAAAVYRNAQMVVTHHPLIYQPLTSVLFDDPVGETVRLLCEKKISLFAAHTNWDVAEGGINDALAKRIGLEELRPLGEEIAPKTYKIVTFLPEKNAGTLIDAMSAAGAGVIGDYRRCAFVQPGSGTFEPMPGAQPHIGQVGKRATVPELRVEMVVDEFHLSDVIEALNRTHPYEEPAFDVYPQYGLKRAGIGRVGRLSAPTTLEEFARLVGERLNYSAVRFWGKPHSLIQIVAVVGGSGGDYLAKAKRAGADALVTGEARHHHTWEADSRHIGLIDASHEATELPGVEALAEYLKAELQPRMVKVEMI